MALTNQLPVSGSFIDPDITVGFDIDDTYTTMRIEVNTLAGVEYAWDSSLGGQQTGYEVSVTDNGDGTESWTLLRDAGWDQDPQVVTVFENESGADVETALSWLLSGSVQYPQSDKPYYSELGAGFKITEDNVGIVVNVTHLDFVAGAEDGITVTDLGGGKVRLTARATTNDPDAIHTNVAGEINALTEKVAPSSGDLVIIEDSAASFVKKKAERQNMGGARTPQKLEADSDGSTIMLYNFDGVLTDAITGTHTLDQVVGPQQLYGFGAVPEARGLFLEYNTGVASTVATMNATKKVETNGDFTAQVAFFIGKATSEDALVDCDLFSVRESGTGSVQTWSLGFDAGGNLYPEARYLDDTSTTIKTGSASTNMVVTDGQHIHMAQRVYDAGGGLYTQELWLNNFLIASDAGSSAPYITAGADTFNVIVGKSGVPNSGICRMVVESCKLSNRKLTDTELANDFRKALGYPAV